jgi:hypothetical protein
MEPSFQALMAGIIDYAGLFPPAKLPLDRAIRDYARYRTEPEAWMLVRFICPAARLGELAPYGEELFRAGPPFRFSALGRGGRTKDEFLAGVRADMEDVASFLRRHGADVVVDAYETRLPDTVVRDAGEAGCRDLLQTTTSLFADHGPTSLTAFYEATPGENWKNEIAAVVEAISGHNQRLPKNRVQAVGFKLRCGGVEASAFPAVKQVAFVVAACRDAGVPLKCTAGLHHPIRHYDDGVATKMHGFVNVFGAGVLAHARRLSEQQVRAVIDDESPNSFVFDGETFRWKDVAVSTDEIVAARLRAVPSFGSCSFDEPREDLRALGLL